MELRVATLFRSIPHGGSGNKMSDCSTDPRIVKPFSGRYPDHLLFVAT